MVASFPFSSTLRSSKTFARPKWFSCADDGKIYIYIQNIALGLDVDSTTFGGVQRGLGKHKLSGFSLLFNEPN